MLASNGTHDWDLDYRGQFVVANNTAWLRSLEERVVREAAAGGAEGAAMATSALARSKLRGRTDLGPMRATLDSVTATLLDLFSLVDARYLLGVSAPSGGRAVASRRGTAGPHGPASPHCPSLPAPRRPGVLLDAVAERVLLSRRGAHVRNVGRGGPARAPAGRPRPPPRRPRPPSAPRADSNMCWMLMHPTSPHALLPPARDAAHVRADPARDAPWPAALSDCRPRRDEGLMPLRSFLSGVVGLVPLVAVSDEEHAFARSEDGQSWPLIGTSSQSAGSR